eukprot:3435573-Rhodomonas_salina.2
MSSRSALSGPDRTPDDDPRYDADRLVSEKRARDIPDPDNEPDMKTFTVKNTAGLVREVTILSTRCSSPTLTSERPRAVGLM